MEKRICHPLTKLAYNLLCIWYTINFIYSQRYQFDIESQEGSMVIVLMKINNNYTKLNVQFW